MALIGIGFIATYAVVTGQRVYLDVASVVALIAFLGTVGFAYYLRRKGVAVKEAVVAVFMVTGGLFMLMAGLGVLRFPDLYTRISAATKASTLGAGFSLIALAVHFSD